MIIHGFMHDQGGAVVILQVAKAEKGREHLRMRCATGIDMDIWQVAYFRSLWVEETVPPLDLSKMPAGAFEIANVGTVSDGMDVKPVHAFLKAAIRKFDCDDHAIGAFNQRRRADGVAAVTNDRGFETARTGV